MSKSKMLNDFLEAMSLIAKNEVKKTDADVTVVMEITEVQGGDYFLKYQGANYHIQSDLQFKKGDFVYVTCLEGIGGTTKVILGKAPAIKGAGAELIIEEYIPQGPNILSSQALLDENGNVLLSKEARVLLGNKPILNKDNRILTIIGDDLNLLLTAYVKTYKRLLFKANFNVKLDIDENNDFEIRIKFKDGKTVAFTMNDMEGVPYQQENQTQALKIKLTDAEVQNFNGISSIELVATNGNDNIYNFITIDELFLTSASLKGEIKQPVAQLVNISSKTTLETAEDEIILGAIISTPDGAPIDGTFTWKQQEEDGTLIDYPDFNSQLVVLSWDNMPAYSSILLCQYGDLLTNSIEIININGKQVTSTLSRSLDDKECVVISIAPNDAHYKWYKIDEFGKTNLLGDQSYELLIINQYNDISGGAQYYAKVYNTQDFKHYLGTTKIHNVYQLFKSTAFFLDLSKDMDTVITDSNGEPWMREDPDYITSTIITALEGNESRELTEKNLTVPNSFKTSDGEINQDLLVLDKNILKIKGFPNDDNDTYYFTVTFSHISKTFTVQKRVSEEDYNLLNPQSIIKLDQGGSFYISIQHTDIYGGNALVSTNNVDLLLNEATKVGNNTVAVRAKFLNKDDQVIDKDVSISRITNNSTLITIAYSKNVEKIILTLLVKRNNVWEEWSIQTIEGVRDGIDAITAFSLALTNDSDLVPATEAHGVDIATALGGARTIVSVYKYGISITDADINCSVKAYTTDNTDGILLTKNTHYSYENNTFILKTWENGNATTSPWNTVIATFTYVGEIDQSIIDVTKDFVITKFTAEKGEQGDAAVDYTLRITPNVFNATETPDPTIEIQVVKITGQSQETLKSGLIKYQYDNSGEWFELNIQNNGKASFKWLAGKIAARVVYEVEDGVYEYEDINTFKDGTSPYSIELDKYNVSIAADENGAVDNSIIQDATTVSVSVFNGKTDITNKCYYTWSAKPLDIEDSLDLLYGNNGANVSTNAIASMTTSDKVDHDNAMLTVDVFLDEEKQIKLGSKTLMVSKNRAGASLVDYSLKASPSTINVSEIVNTAQITFTVIKTVGKSPETLTSGYMIKNSSGTTIVNNSYTVDSTFQGDTFILYINENGNFVETDRITVAIVKNSSVPGPEGPATPVYSLVPTPTQFNQNSMPEDGQLISFAVIKYEKGVSTKLTSGYQIKNGDQVLSNDQCRIKITTTFDLFINDVKVDSKTVVAVKDGDDAEPAIQYYNFIRYSEGSIKPTNANKEKLLTSPVATTEWVGTYAGTKANPTADDYQWQTYLGDKDYVTDDELNETLNDYVTDDKLNNALGDYVTDNELNGALNDYVTDDELNGALEDTNSKIDNLESEVIQGFKDVNTAIDNIQEGVFDIITEEDINDLFKEEDPEPDPDPGPSRPENNSEHTGSGKGTFGEAEEVAYDEWSIDINYLGYSTEQEPGGISGECQVTESPKANGEYDSDDFIDFPLNFSAAGKILSIAITVSSLAYAYIFDKFIFEAEFGGYSIESNGATWILTTNNINTASNHITINYDTPGYIRSEIIQSITVKTVDI